MIKALLRWLDVSASKMIPPEYGKFRHYTNLQWNMHVTVLHVLKKTNNGLKQYWADRLMLELLKQGRL